MTITEQEIYEALNVQAPEDKLGAAEDRAQISGAGAAEKPEQQELSEQTQDTLADQNDPGEPEEAGSREDSDKNAGAAEKPEQSLAERRANAARRRNQERQEAIDAAVREALKAEREKAQSEMTAFFASAGLKNTITGQPITSMAEFKTWKTAFDSMKLQRDLKSGTLTQEGLQAVIEQSPVIKRISQLADAQEEAKRQQDETAAKLRLDAEIEQIGKLDPNVRSMEDLLKQPWSKDFYGYVKKGNSFIDAFYLANREKLNANTAEAARQQAMNNQRGKDHLTSSTARTAGSVSVPKEEMAMFREFMPNAKEEEIQAYYNKYKNG